MATVMPYETHRLCPVCGETLAVDPPTDAAWDRSASSIEELVRGSMERQAAEIDRRLRDAVEAHQCRHPRRWARWKQRNRAVLAGGG